MADIGERRNTYDDPTTPPAIELNSSTFIKIFNAKKDRIGLEAGNLDGQSFVILAKDPGVDHTTRGQLVFGRSIYGSSTGRIPVGPIYAKALNGSPSVLFQEE